MMPEVLYWVDSENRGRKVKKKEDCLEGEGKRKSNRFGFRYVAFKIQMKDNIGNLGSRCNFSFY